MKKILIVVDMQNDFIDGTLGTPEAQAIVPKVVKKIENFDGDKIILTQDTHFEDYMKTQEGRRLPVSHCIYGTNGWKLNKNIENAINKYEKDSEEKGIILSVLRVKKETFGSVYLPNFLEWARADEMEIEVCGLCSDICVISNAMILKTHYPEAHLIIDASCCAGVTPESHKNALEAMKMCQIDVINE